MGLNLLKTPLSTPAGSGLIFVSMTRFSFALCAEAASG